MTRGQAAAVGSTLGVIAAIVYHIHISSTFCHEIVVLNEAPPIPYPPSSFFGGCPRPIPTARSLVELGDAILKSEDSKQYETAAVIGGVFDSSTRGMLLKMADLKALFTFSVDPAVIEGSIIPTPADSAPDGNARSVCDALRARLIGHPRSGLIHLVHAVLTGPPLSDESTPGALTSVRNVHCCDARGETINCKVRSTNHTMPLVELMDAYVTSGFDITYTYVTTTKKGAQSLAQTAWDITASGGVVVGAAFTDATETAKLGAVSYSKHEHLKSPRSGILTFADKVKRQVSTVIEPVPVHWYVRR